MAVYRNIYRDDVLGDTYKSAGKWPSLEAAERGARMMSDVWKGLHLVRTVREEA